MFGYVVGLRHPTNSARADVKKDVATVQPATGASATTANWIADDVGEQDRSRVVVVGDHLVGCLETVSDFIGKNVPE